MHVIHKHTDNGNCTVLHEGGAFAVIRAPTDPRWREEKLALPNRGEALCSLQLRQFAAGLVTIEPVWCIRGWWYLRNTSNLGVTHPAGHERFLTLQECIAGAIRWWEGRPSHYEVICRANDAALIFVSGRVGDAYELRRHIGLA